MTIQVDRVQLLECQMNALVQLTLHLAAVLEDQGLLDPMSLDASLRRTHWPEMSGKDNLVTRNTVAELLGRLADARQHRAQRRKR